jgi:hypothetical protein
MAEPADATAETTTPRTLTVDVKRIKARIGPSWLEWAGFMLFAFLVLATLGSLQKRNEVLADILDRQWRWHYQQTLYNRARDIIMIPMAQRAGVPEDNIKQYIDVTSQIRADIDEVLTMPNNGIVKPVNNK